MDLLVSCKGQMSIPIALRRKYGVRAGTKVRIQCCPSGKILKIGLKIEDLAGADAHKIKVEKALKIIDEQREPSTCLNGPIKHLVETSKKVSVGLSAEELKQKSDQERLRLYRNKLRDSH